MKRIVLAIICFVATMKADAQPPETTPIDSTTFTFSRSDSLVHREPKSNFSYLPDTAKLRIDTTGCHLWRIGSTRKPFDTVASAGIMTDTLQPYPANANDWFTLRFDERISNPKIELWHEYNTRLRHAGCTIEFSTDTGNSWLNVIDNWLMDEQNMYTYTDTLLSGIPAFMGTSTGQQHTTFQIINCVGSKSAQAASYALIRFRFISDTLVDSLAGWKIDSIKVTGETCIPGSVTTVTKGSPITVVPNPSYNGVFNLSGSVFATGAIVTVYNLNGSVITSMPYTGRVDIHNYPEGMYFYKVTDGKVNYTGKLVYR